MVACDRIGDNVDGSLGLVWFVVASPRWDCYIYWLCLVRCMLKLSCFAPCSLRQGCDFIPLSGWWCHGCVSEMVERHQGGLCTSSYVQAAKVFVFGEENRDFIMAKNCYFGCRFCLCFSVVLPVSEDFRSNVLNKA